MGMEALHVMSLVHWDVGVLIVNIYANVVIMPLVIPTMVSAIAQGDGEERLVEKNVLQASMGKTVQKNVDA